MARHIGIVVPTTLELAPLLEFIPQLKQTALSPWQIYGAELSGVKVTVIISFIGPANAAAATEHLISLKPDFILHGGAAGAINESLLPGDLVIASASKIICSKEVLEVRKTLLMATTSIRYLKNGEPVRLDQLDGDSDLIAQSLTMAEQFKAIFPIWDGPGWPGHLVKREPQLLTGTVGSLDGWTKGLAQLNFVRENFAVDAEDMESAYIAQVAAIHGLPNLAIRAISNNEYLQTLEKSEIIPAVQAAAKRVAFIIKELIERSEP
ncbi:5'-methylthioadenosine nucleosidase [soil metagenome]